MVILRRAMTGLLTGVTVWLREEETKNGGIPNPGVGARIPNRWHPAIWGAHQSRSKAETTTRLI